LSKHGLLIVCRTKADRSNHGTIFQLQGDSFTALGRIGDGSEVEQLVNT